MAALASWAQGCAVVLTQTLHAATFCWNVSSTRNSCGRPAVRMEKYLGERTTWVSVETGRVAAAAATLGSRRRRRDDVDIPKRRVVRDGRFRRGRGYATSEAAALGTDRRATKWHRRAASFADAASSDGPEGRGETVPYLRAPTRSRPYEHRFR